MIKKAIIFGAGYTGRNALRVCRKKKIKVLFFVDNNKKFQNKKVLGKKIYSPNLIKKTKFDKIIISGRYNKQIINQLKFMKIDYNKYLIWGKKELRLSKKILNKRNLVILRALKKIIFYLRKFKIKFWIDLGALLFLLRKQDLAETSDVDIISNYSDLLKLEKICKEISQKNKNYLFKKRSIYKSKLLNKSNINQLSLIKINNKNLNFEPAIFEFNLLVKKNKYGENLAKRKILNLKYWNGQNFIKYKNILLPVPINAQNYLSKIYGDNWKVKKNFF